MAAKKRRLSKLEKRYYKKHPPATVAPVTKVMLKARGARAGRGKSLASDKIASKLYRFSVQRGRGVKLSPSSPLVLSLSRLGLIGASGTITARGEKMLADYRRRKVLRPSLATRRGNNKRWLAH